MTISHVVPVFVCLWQKEIQIGTKSICCVHSPTTFTITLPSIVLLILRGYSNVCVCHYFGEWNLTVCTLWDPIIWMCVLDTLVCTGSWLMGFVSEKAIYSGHIRPCDCLFFYLLYVLSIYLFVGSTGIKLQFSLIYIWSHGVLLRGVQKNGNVIRPWWFSLVHSHFNSWFAPNSPAMNTFRFVSRHGLFFRLLFSFKTQMDDSNVSHFGQECGKARNEYTRIGARELETEKKTSRWSVIGKHHLVDVKDRWNDLFD